MKEKTTVQAAFVHALFHEVLELGFDAPRLVARSGFDPGKHPDLDGRLPHAVYLQLWQAVLEQADDPGFALKLGASVDPRQMGILGSVVLSCRTLAEVGQQFIRHARLLNSLYRVEAAVQDQRFVYRYVADCPPELEAGFVETHFAAAISLCRLLADTDIVPLEMRFRYPEPAHVKQYQALFGAALRFNQNDNAMLLDVCVMELPVAQHNPYTNTLASRHAAMLLEQLERADSLLGRVQQHIMDTLSTGAGIESCATALNMTPRTLQRKLREEGSSFQDLQEAMRRKLAFDYLSQPFPYIPIVEVALLLGYSEPSAFHRAFKRWSGVSAAAYRQDALS